MNKILCFLGFHKDIQEKEDVFKSDNLETYNYRFVCSRCGRKTEWKGATHFSMKIINN